MASTQFPSTLSHEKKEFIKAFYSVSDVPGATDKYMDFLTEDVDFIMGLKAIHGVPAVRKMRETMWSDVTTRRHTPTQVSYGLKNGTSVEDVGWAARMVFAQGGELKMKSYQAGRTQYRSFHVVFTDPRALLSTLAMFQVWLDAAPLADAVKEMHKN